VSTPDMFDLYFYYRKNTEPPPIFHRWAITACIGAWMGRQVWIPFGDNRIFPQQYIMFVGDPGSRKTTAINMAVKILRATGFDKLAAKRTSKEKFLLDLSGEPEEVSSRGEHSIKGAMEALEGISMLNTNTDTPSEVLISADEFNNFMGPANLEFQSILGELWDWDDKERGYSYRLKNSRDVNIFQPTVSILSGNTPSNFALCFPPASIGQGFMSRLLLIHGEGTGVKVSFPEESDQQLTDKLIAQFLWMKKEIHGAMLMTKQARDMLDTIYRTWPELEDVRFKHYSTRRFTHLLRLCIIYACARISPEIEAIDVIRANTVLAYAETLMPKALGELGKNKSAEAANKVMSALFSARKPITFQSLWKIVSNDLDKPQDLTQLLANLQYADKIQVAPSGDKGNVGYLPKTKIIDRKLLYIDQNYLKGKEVP
jgi:hypothetical protein